MSNDIPASIKFLVKQLNENSSFSRQLSLSTTYSEFIAFEDVSSLSLMSALIPQEQASRPPRILICSGSSPSGIYWRILRCPGGPVVLQLILPNFCVALWSEN